MITAIEPKCADDGRYSVMQTCSLLGITRNTLEKYRTLNLIRAGFRKATGRKYYIGKDIKKLWRTL